MSAQQESFFVNWTVGGSVIVKAESEEAAHQIVRRTSLAKLLTIRWPDYELEIHKTEDSDGDPALSEQELRGPTAPDSMAELLGE